MSRAFIRKLYSKASKGKYALGAFNFSTMSIIHCIIYTALRLKSPIIVSTSEGERKFFAPVKFSEF